MKGTQQKLNQSRKDGILKVNPLLDGRRPAQWATRFTNIPVDDIKKSFSDRDVRVRYIPRTMEYLSIICLFTCCVQ